MDYSIILAEVEPKVRIRPLPTNYVMEDILQNTMASRFTEEECYPGTVDTNVCFFMQILFHKHPTEYKKKVLQWIQHVAGAWNQPREVHVALDNWVQEKVRNYREAMGLDEPESEEEDHAEYTRLGDIPLRRR